MRIDVTPLPYLDITVQYIYFIGTLLQMAIATVCPLDGTKAVIYSCYPAAMARFGVTSNRIHVTPYMVLLIVTNTVMP